MRSPLGLLVAHLACLPAPPTPAGQEAQPKGQGQGEHGASTAAGRSAASRKGAGAGGAHLQVGVRRVCVLACWFGV